MDTISGSREIDSPPPQSSYTSDGYLVPNAEQRAKTEGERVMELAANLTTQTPFALSYPAENRAFLAVTLDGEFWSNSAVGKQVDLAHPTQQTVAFFRGFLRACAHGTF